MTTHLTFITLNVPNGIYSSSFNCCKLQAGTSMMNFVLNWKPLDQIFFVLHILQMLD